ncbi:cytochrome b [Salinarimonas soli]|uniref:Cytochrome b n=1 Tax=Salinarimonas soli TaxID=1638099 RepID=A0A5B2VC88_9HYPH|nr:cytochrome b [Salinarimonas soli]KAA2236080.1 cytochrome b [Salinarimonas soli]
MTDPRTDTAPRRVVVADAAATRSPQASAIAAEYDEVYADAQDNGTGGSYDNVIKALHWTIVAVVLLQLFMGYTLGGAEPGQPAGYVLGFHMGTGATILAIMLFRLGWRLTHLHHVPPSPKDLPRWLQIVSRVNHYYFYAALIAMPVLGLAWASSRGWQPTYFGLFPLPKILPNGSPLGNIAAIGHSVLAHLTVFAIALHVTGALYHRFGKHDRVIHRMLPSNRA